MAQKEGNIILVRVAKLLRLSIYAYLYIYRDSWGWICCEVVAIYMYICIFTETVGVEFVVRLLPYICLFVYLQG